MLLNEVSRCAGGKITGACAIKKPSMKPLLSVAAVLAAISLAVPTSFALDPVQAKRIKKTVNSAAIPEIPGVVASLVTQAAKQDREEVAIAAVQSALYKAPSSAPMVVSAIAKAAPEVSDVVLKKAIEMEPTQFATVAADGRGQGRGGINRGGGDGNSDGNRGGGAVNTTSGQGNTGPRGQPNGNAYGRFDPSEHNPGPNLPGSPQHHNRPPHPRGGPPGLVDYSKPRPHH